MAGCTNTREPTKSTAGKVPASMAATSLACSAGLMLAPPKYVTMSWAEMLFSQPIGFSSPNGKGLLGQGLGRESVVS